MWTMNVRDSPPEVMLSLLSPAFSVPGQVDPASGAEVPLELPELDPPPPELLPEPPELLEPPEPLLAPPEPLPDPELLEPPELLPDPLEPLLAPELDDAAPEPDPELDPGLTPELDPVPELDPLEREPSLASGPVSPPELAVPQPAALSRRARAAMPAMAVKHEKARELFIKGLTFRSLRKAAKARGPDRGPARSCGCIGLAATRIDYPIVILAQSAIWRRTAPGMLDRADRRRRSPLRDGRRAPRRSRRSPSPAPSAAGRATDTQARGP
jgi:hypothetical protein